MQCLISYAIYVFVVETMKVHINDLQTDLPLRHQKKKLDKLVQSLLQFLDQKCDELSITFVDAKEIKKLHKRFFNDGSFTDCITLPMDDTEDGGYRVLGELFICPKAAIDYANSNNEDPYKETTLYVIHGILHLIGYDDIKVKDQRKMREQEKLCLDFLEKSKLLLQAPRGK